MNLAVVIPAYEKVSDVLVCLNSLRALSSDASRIAWHVQDDGSPSVNFPRVIPREVASCTRNDLNLGFAGNANLGAFDAMQRYRPDVLFFANQDVYAVTEWSMGWDVSLLAAFEDPLVGVAAPRLLFPNGSIQSAGGVFDAIGQPTHRCLGWTNPRVCDDPEDVPWATGAALAVRADLFMQLGGFDEGYRMYFEDVSLGVRVREAGKLVRYQPSCTLMHSVGSTGGSPYFQASALRFKKEFVDSGRVKPGTLTPTVRYW